MFSKNKGHPEVLKSHMLKFSLSIISCMRLVLFLMFMEAKLPVNLLHYRLHIVRKQVEIIVGIALHLFST